MLARSRWRSSVKPYGAGGDHGLGRIGHGGAAMYIHFTCKAHAESIVVERKLMPCSYLGSFTEGMAPAYGIAVGGEYVPSVQRSPLGRSDVMDTAVLFTTEAEPKWIAPEEVVWDVPIDGALVLSDAVIIGLEDAIGCLDGSAGIPEPY